LSSTGETSQCNDSNRPPESSPTNRDTGEALNINAMLQDSVQWANTVNQNILMNASPISLLQSHIYKIARLVTLHKAGGDFDVIHAKDTDYVGSTTTGNFLYGANGIAMGIPEDILLRGAAFYQAISDNGLGWSSFGQGLINFIKNDGDHLGDPEQTLQGIRYTKEVYMNNQEDTSPVSCDPADANIDPPSGGGGPLEPPGGGNPGPVGGGGPSIGVTIPPIKGFTWWCFVQPSYPTYCWQE